MANLFGVMLVDDHILLRRGLAKLVDSFSDFRVLAEADNGMHLQQVIPNSEPPDIVLVDVNMPKMDGFETTKWLKHFHPLTKVLALSMYDNEISVIRMFKAGAGGYILKDCEPSELKAALDSMMATGYFYSQLVSGKLIHSIQKSQVSDLNSLSSLSQKETNFLKLCCTEMTYKEIADVLFVSPRTVDGYRDSLFEKLQLKTRTGLVLFALKNGFAHF